jgi:hypothetical protein
MTDQLRVILEIGKKRRVVAGAMDWPGLDRGGTSEDDALAKLSTYLPRYAAVAERAGMASAFKRLRTPEVVERVPGSSSTDFWGIAHVPSEIEREVLSAKDLERRLKLLQACWAYFDDVVARVSKELRPGGRGGGRSRDQIIRHTYGTEPTSCSPRRALWRIGRNISLPSAPTTLRASLRAPGRSSSSSAALPITSWITRGRWRIGGRHN